MHSRWRLSAVTGCLYRARHTSYRREFWTNTFRAAAEVLVDLIFRPNLRPRNLALERKVVLRESIPSTIPRMTGLSSCHNAHLWAGHPYGYSSSDPRDTSRAHRRRSAKPPLPRLPSRPIVGGSRRNVEHDALTDVLEATVWADIRAGIAELVSPAPIVQALQPCTSKETPPRLTSSSAAPRSSTATAPLRHDD